MAPAETSVANVDDVTFSTLLERYKNIKLFDAHKNSLIEELLTRLDSVSKQRFQERAEFENQRKWAEQDVQVSQHKFAQLQEFLSRDSFVLVIIDGADLVFRNSFLRDGDTGGRRCAAQLHQAINEYVFSSVDDLPPETKIFVRLYADIDDLVGLFVSTGVVDTGAKVRGFMRGFVQDRTLFDITNVYSQGRETIIDKVEAQLKQHLYDFRCRHIVLGCSDDGIYAPVLKKIALDVDLHRRTTILSGTPLSAGLTELPFQSTRIPEVFRNTRIDVHRNIDHIMELEPIPVTTLPSAIGTPLGVLTPPLSTPTLSVRSDSRNINHGDMILPSTPVNSSIQESAPKPMTWASISKKSAALPITMSDKLQLKEHSVSGIRRNKSGQRLDPAPPEYKRDEVNRVKKLKLCNAHYLRGDCPHKDANCTHEHLYKCTKSEIETLRLVARMSCCVHDSKCDDEKCIYGHNCPFPEAKEGSMRGKGCLNGDSCRFPPHMHGMDMIPVRVTKIT